ncbi:MAG: hypothetical protein MK214_15095 [Thalassotalea sp.]|nr:hypothetical protein [Thalassotalea sp.]
MHEKTNQNKEAKTLTPNQIAIEWMDDANNISQELSKTLMIVSATLLVFSTAIPSHPAIDTSNPQWMYRIPWILILLSLMFGILFHLLKNHRLRTHAAALLSGHEFSFRSGLNIGSPPYKSEKLCIVLQPLLLLIGLTTTGVLVLW